VLGAPLDDVAREPGDGAVGAGRHGEWARAGSTASRARCTLSGVSLEPEASRSLSPSPIEGAGGRPDGMRLEADVHESHRAHLCDELRPALRGAEAPASVAEQRCRAEDVVARDRPRTSENSSRPLAAWLAGSTVTARHSRRENPRGLRINSAPLVRGELGQD
jgi:hypothetical protein